MKRSLLFLLLFVVLVTVLMFLFFKFDKSGAGNNNNEISTEDTAEGFVDYSIQSDFSPAVTVTEQNYSPSDTLSLSKLEKEAVKAVALCEDVYASVDKGDVYNVSLTDSEVAAMVSALGSGGYSAIDYYGKLDMVNYKPVEDFGESVTIGKNAECAYFVVHPDGLVHEVRLSYRNGQATVVTVSMEWDKKGKPSVYNTNQYVASYINYSSNGWLTFSRAAIESTSETAPAANTNTMVRVEPYDSARRNLCNRFITSINYTENNLFTSNWSSGNFSELDFNSLYPALFGCYYGTDMLTAVTATTVAGLKMVEGTNLHLVPAENFERVICHYFQISTDTLRALSDYSYKKDAYYIIAPQEEFESTSTHLPEPELVDYWYNSDGSLTMKVNAVSVWYGTDCSFTHELTIMETDEGFVYISNYVHPDENNRIPSSRLITERKTEISQLGN